jgi:formiminotetrahydrofolate cyclodeaminase
VRAYSNVSLRDLLDAFASTVPAPGGGSGAALTGAIGVSLLLMVAGIRAARPTGAPASNELAESTDRLRSLRPVIASLIDRDAEAYSHVITALRTPVTDDASEVRQREAFEAAMRTATEIPLETMRACRRALREAMVVAAHSTRGTRGDVGVAIELLRAAVRGAGITIDANLGSLRDVGYAGRLRSERQQLEEEADADAGRGLSELSSRTT